jgi:hypothetical protein
MTPLPKLFYLLLIQNIIPDRIKFCTRCPGCPVLIFHHLPEGRLRHPYQMGGEALVEKLARIFLFSKGLISCTPICTLSKNIMEKAAELVVNLLILLVGARGFEPPTSCSQSRRAASLRHAPIKD